jgi:hypothetical protein
MTGLVGDLHEIGVKEGNVLIFVMPRATRLMNGNYKDEGKKALEEILPDGRTALIMGVDVDIYELCGEEALSLKLKGMLDDPTLMPMRRRKSDK